MENEFEEDQTLEEQHSLKESPRNWPSESSALSSTTMTMSTQADGCFDCNICLDFAMDPVVTLCGHLYCWPCIYKWLELSSSTTQKQCPVCKTTLSETKLVPLYGRGNTSDNKETNVNGSSIDIPRRPTLNTAIVATALCFNMIITMGTHCLCLLTAIGVGEKSATVIGATFQWFLRDFTGMVGGILFTFYQGSNLDSNAKMWRLVADFMNDLGMLMDLVSPLFPSALVPIVCLGSLSRSFTGVASGATRAALTQHFSLENNAADISAKEGSQETLATMVGMALGMFIAHIARGNPVFIWTCFLFLTAFHVYANYKAVCCLSLSTLNSERSSILLQHFMETGEVLSPNYVSTMEHVFPPWIHLLNSNTAKYKLLHRIVYLGVRVSSLKDSDMMELWRLANSHYYVTEKYLLLERKKGVFVFVHKDSSPADILRCFFHALVIANLNGKADSLYKQSQEWMNEHYQSFILRLRSSGWKTERLLSPAIIWRTNWVHMSPNNKQD